jgi:hypothetical protein
MKQLMQLVSTGLYTIQNVDIRIHKCLSLEICNLGMLYNKDPSSVTVSHSERSDRK